MKLELLVEKKLSPQNRRPPQKGRSEKAFIPAEEDRCLTVNSARSAALFKLADETAEEGDEGEEKEF